MTPQYVKSEVALEALVKAASEGDLDRLQQCLYDLETSPSLPLESRSREQPRLSLQSALHAAAKNDHDQSVNYLIEKGFEIDTSTIVAATAGRAFRVFEVLLKHNWDINICLGHIGDALILAVGADDTALVRFLISHGADPNRNLRGESRSALECGAYSSSIPTLKLLLDAGAQMKTRSALTIAARKGRTDVVAYLLDRGAEIDEIPDNEDIYDNDRQYGIGNALSIAAREGKVDVVRFLLERGANRTVQDTLGKKPLDLAKINNHAKCVEILGIV